MRKINGKDFDFVKGLLITILILVGIFMVVDLYTPFKKLIMGNNLNFNEIFSYVQLKQQLPAIIAASLALEFGRFRKKCKVDS